LRDRSGASAIVVSLSLTAVLGAAGLAVDLGTAYAQRRQAQNAADSAAFSGAAAAFAGATDVAGQAGAVAARYGFRDGVNGVTVTVRSPPAEGGYAGDPLAVEVIIRRPGPRFFSSLIVSSAQIVRARAVGRAGTHGDACVLALSQEASASAAETGKADIRLNGCSLFANSSSPTALQLNGGASLTATTVGVVGGYSVSSNATLTTTSGVRTNQKPLADPYNDVPVPRPDKCTYNGASLSGVQRIANAGPTVFCNGLSINAGANITLDPGVYIIDRGDLTVNGGATLTGTAVTIVLTSSTGSNYATVHINGNSTIDLSAPASGATAGLVFFQDRRAPGGVGNVFNGGSTQRINGAIYFPNQLVTFTGGSTTQTSGCTQLLASEIAFKGNSSLRFECAGTGVRAAGGTATSLVE
jgi:hypothetical protein